MNICDGCIFQDASDAEERCCVRTIVHGMAWNYDKRHATVSDSSRQPNFRPNILLIGE
jgi:hypothetical protein